MEQTYFTHAIDHFYSLCHFYSLRLLTCLLLLLLSLVIPIHRIAHRGTMNVACLLN